MCDLCRRDYESTWKKKKSTDNVVLGFHIKIRIKDFDFKDYTQMDNHFFFVCWHVRRKKKRPKYSGIGLMSPNAYKLSGYLNGREHLCLFVTRDKET